MRSAYLSSEMFKASNDFARLEDGDVDAISVRLLTYQDTVTQIEARYNSNTMHNLIE